MADLTRRSFLGLLGAGAARLLLPYEPKTIYSFPSERIIGIDFVYGHAFEVTREMWEDGEFTVFHRYLPATYGTWNEALNGHPPRNR